MLSGAALALRPPRGTAVRSAPAAAAAVSASGAPPISYRNKTLSVFIIILSFQVLFPRLLRKCGVAVSIRLVCRKTRQAVSRVLSGMAGICLSGIFTVFFSFFCAGRPVLSSLGPADVPRPCRIFFPSGCPVPSVIITAGLSCHCPVPCGNGAAGGAVFRWWCGGAKEGERRDGYASGRNKRKNKKNVTFFEKKL